MQNILLNSIRSSICHINCKSTYSYLNKQRFILPAVNQIIHNNFATSQHKQNIKKLSLFSNPNLCTNNTSAILMKQINKQSSLIYRLQSNSPGQPENTVNQTTNEKKPSKFKQFYTQYGPLFVVVHLITVVLWIYGFFLISKQYVFKTKFSYRIPNF